MPRISNSLVGILNFLVFLLSIPILGSGIWLATRHGTDCERFLQGPVIIIGVFIMLISLAGFVGACFRVSWLLWIYLFVTFLLIILLFCFTIFAFVVTNKGAGQLASDKGYKEYRLGDYSHWLQDRVQNGDNWRKIKSCIRDTKVCKSLSQDYVYNVATEFYLRNLSPIQAGCCKPPSSCGYVYRNATYWDWVPPSPTATSDSDCASWSNDQDQLCYNCNSCRAGVLASVKHDWRKVAALNIILLIFLIVVYSLGCCAFRNNGRSAGYRRPKGYP
ncbi:hypothetical protein SUGI_0646130 [Cryptomeria japonica]|uniref:tetraspanin-8 n=1 Tax=Cryptomeria japonica TaxID=3369 RepID=UPI002414A7BF|nr:tetraspanin-8 [Cryptomeria japonica]GLJ32091.1 hypothetical protein SUGI_0646130 [Cryptomeria japonica]